MGHDAKTFERTPRVEGLFATKKAEGGAHEPLPVIAQRELKKIGHDMKPNYTEARAGVTQHIYRDADQYTGTFLFFRTLMQGILGGVLAAVLIKGGLSVGPLVAFGAAMAGGLVPFFVVAALTAAFAYSIYLMVFGKKDMAIPLFSRRK
ncbi:MAG: hypothetical protein RLZZ283_650 [Candidatus Parcubacteria bacterium]|jgi:hypothetical protein